MTYRWSTMTNEHWLGFTQIDARFCLELNVFDMSHSFHILFLTDQMKGFVSIFQLLGRYVRRISVVFHRNFTRRDNQHVRFSLHKQPVRLQILRNFVVHKPHTRKNCFTEPLRRMIEPLRRNIEPHCGIIEPLRRNVEHHCELGPVHTYPDIFESATFSFRIRKYLRPHVMWSQRIHIEFARPHVSGFTPDSLRIVKIVPPGTGSSRSNPVSSRTALLSYTFKLFLPAVLSGR